eukprot:6186937-Pleurochrysis_carterae.AAC.2
MIGRHVSNRHLISKSKTPTKYRHHATPTGYLPTTIGLLTRRLPTTKVKGFAICRHITGNSVSPAGQRFRHPCCWVNFTLTSRPARICKS